jgi:hypothetical protein
MKVQPIGFVARLVYPSRVFWEERSKGGKEGIPFIPGEEASEIDAAGELVEEASGKERLRESEFVAEREWYRSNVERVKLIDRIYRTSEMGKNKDLPPDEVGCFGRESLYEAFWRTLVCDIDADGKRPVDLSQAF